MTNEEEARRLHHRAISDAEELYFTADDPSDGADAIRAIDAALDFYKAERDKALAQVEQMRAVVREAVAFLDRTERIAIDELDALRNVLASQPHKTIHETFADAALEDISRGYDSHLNGERTRQEVADCQHVYSNGSRCQTWPSQHVNHEYVPPVVDSAAEPLRPCMNCGGHMVSDNISCPNCEEPAEDEAVCGYVYNGTEGIYVGPCPHPESAHTPPIHPFTPRQEAV